MFGRDRRIGSTYLGGFGRTERIDASTPNSSPKYGSLYSSIGVHRNHGTCRLSSVRLCGAGAAPKFVLIPERLPRPRAHFGLWGGDCSGNLSRRCGGTGVCVGARAYGHPAVAERSGR